MNDLIMPNVQIPESTIEATPIDYPLCKTEEDALIYLSMLLNPAFVYSNGFSYDLTDYEKIFYIEENFVSEKVQEKLKKVKHMIVKNYVYKQKYLKRLIDCKIDLDTEGRDPSDGYLDLPGELFKI